MFEKLGFNDDTELKISAYDTRDRFTATRTLLGSACIFVKDMKDKGKTFRLNIFKDIFVIMRDLNLVKISAKSQKFNM
jgi:hypothetical protein